MNDGDPDRLQYSNTSLLSRLRNTKERDIPQLQHIPRNWKRYSTVCHSERVNWVPGSWVQMCSRIVIELLSPASLALSPPSPVAAYPWGPYLACVQSDGMLGKQQSTHGDVDAYEVPASVVPESGPRWIDRAQSRSRVVAKKCETISVIK